MCYHVTAIIGSLTRKQDSDSYLHMNLLQQAHNTTEAESDMTVHVHGYHGYTGSHSQLLSHV